MQRNSRDRSRARDSCPGSDMISSGCTAKAGDKQKTDSPIAKIP
jgi:hypothetical protein